VGYPNVCTGGHHAASLHEGCAYKEAFGKGTSTPS
jgi:hypothetical protein